MSLGVSPIPSKTCNYRCVYCQLGRTTHFTNTRREFFPCNAIFEELQASLHKIDKLDYITFVGEGEPTLYKKLGCLIKKTKRITSYPVCVITNGSLLHKKVVRKELQLADVVLPTFDVGNKYLFRKINRPHKTIHFTQLVEGLQQFRKEFSNQIWLEIMLIRGMNDSPEVLEEIRTYLDRFQPDQVQINTPTRPPTEKWVQAPDEDILRQAEVILETTITLPLNEGGEIDVALFNTPETALSEITKRHPLRWNQALEVIAKLTEQNAESILQNLITSNQFKTFEYRGRLFVYSYKSKY